MPIPDTDSRTSNNRSERITPKNAHRCGQPGQQHGRRIPSLSSEHTLSTCCRLVSSFLTEMVQQIHSLRASGVMSSQAASAFASDASAFWRSAGRLCTTPPEIRMVVIELSRRLSQFLSSCTPEPPHSSRRDPQGAATLHRSTKGHGNSGIAVKDQASDTRVQPEFRDDRRLFFEIHSE